MPGLGVTGRRKVFKQLRPSFSMKVDLYGHEQRYLKWKEYAMKNGEEGLTRSNSDILMQYILDMEIGANVSNRNKKGARSYPRLNNIRQRLVQILRMLQEKKITDITEVSEREITVLFSDMQRGVIKTLQGERYKSAADYIKIFKAFWHWWMKVNRKQGKIITDITEDLDTRRDEKPKWVYLDEDQINLILAKANPNYKTLLAFLFDSGARVTETFSLRVQNISQDNKGDVWADIPDEVSKTFGRKIKLILCGKDILRYIKESGLKEDDLLFSNSVPMVTRHLNELGNELFGDGFSKAGEKYSKLTMYDLRHCSSCYWLKRYKTSGNLMYRFGWKSEKYIHYYSEFLGMKDPIKQEDLYIDITKTDLEKEIGGLKKENLKQRGKVEDLTTENKKIWQVLKKLHNMNAVLLRATTKDKKSETELKKYLKELPSEELLNSISSKK